MSTQQTNCHVNGNTATGSRSSKHKLKVCLLVEAGEPVQDWQKMLIDRVSSDPQLKFVGTIEHTDSKPVTLSSSVFSAVSFLERQLLARTANYVQRYSFERFCTRSTPEGLSGLLETLGTDILINSSKHRIAKDAISHVTFGEWWFNFSEECDSRSDWFGYAPVFEKSPSVELALFASDQNGRTGLISSASFSTKPSGARNNAATKERAVTLLMRELQHVCRLGVISRENSQPRPSTHPLTGLQTFYYLAIVLKEAKRRAVKAVLAKFGKESDLWTLYTGQGTIDDFNLASVVEIPPSMESIRADPFLFEQSGFTYLFYEAYAQGDTKAHIAVARFEGTQLVELGPVLVRPYHLSYPFVFRDGDDIYMIPETHQSRQIEVWKCVEFPLKWELYSTAFHGQSAADTVMVKLDGNWWLFTNLSHFHAYEDHCSELHVFQVDSPNLSQIFPHKSNPVVIGSNVARNAGRIVEQNGSFFRPSQRSEYGIYGYALNIMKITRLTLNEYEEHCVETIDPNFTPGIFGCHHFDAAGGRFVIDARVLTATLLQSKRAAQLAND